MDHSKAVTHVEWCAGYGGIHLGLRRVIPGLRLVAFSEIEAFAASLLVSHMEAGAVDCAPCWTDLKTFPSEQFRGLVDLFSAGFPCQPFSCAGDREADEDPRHLWPYVLAGIIAMRPGVILLENVEGIISAKLGGDGWSDPRGTPVLLHVLRELERVGYIAEAGIFSASEIGAPHRRKRVFILAVLADSEGCFGRLLLRQRGSLEPVLEPRGRGEDLGSVADAGPSERRALALTGEHGQDSDRAGECGGSLAESASERRGEGRAEPIGEQGRRDATERGGAMANAIGPVEPRRESAGGEASGGRAHAESGGSDGLLAAPGDLGDPDHAGPQGRRLLGSGCADERATWASGRAQLALPQFPPGPGLGGAGVVDRIAALYAKKESHSAARELFATELGETLKWGAILSVRPDLAPAVECPVRGVADGRVGGMVSTRVDELRIGGNGVVISTVAKAFTVLSARLAARLTPPLERILKI